MKKPEKPYDPSKPLDIPAREKFAHLIAIKGLSASEAYRQTYKGSLKWDDKSVWEAASKLRAHSKVLPRIQYLLSRMSEDTVMSVMERKKILADIARAKLSDFCSAGADGFVPNVGPENEHSHALESVETRVTITGEGDDKQPAFITKIKLKSAVQAIDILNKMEGSYAAEKLEIDNKLSVMVIGGEEEKPAPGE
jgi:hypothetical protein